MSSIFLPLSVTTVEDDVQAQLSLLTEKKMAAKGLSTLFQQLTGIVVGVAGLVSGVDKLAFDRVKTFVAQLVREPAFPAGAQVSKDLALLSKAGRIDPGGSAVGQHEGEV